MTLSVLRHVEWGDCDAAGIVYYPNYFRWMDGGFHEICNRFNFNQRIFQSDFGYLGTPLLESTATFKKPVTYGETLEITVDFVAMGRTSFTISYHFFRESELVLLGQESRIFVKMDDERKIVPADIPEEFRRTFPISAESIDAI